MPQFRHAQRRWGNIAVVAPQDWVSAADSAAALGVADLGLRIAPGGCLTPADRGDGEVGVTRTSLERELAFRSHASRWRRLGRSLRRATHFISF